MPSDSLTLSNYMAIARWLTGTLEPRIGGQKGTTASSYYPEDMQMPEEEQNLLWNAFYASNREEVK